ncbi:hypothetical protein DICPUDRAFT_157428 [Dictyostelium purpureum]|uniref:Uncharacterized protein n=1 Tax=Dictyostelium purpureum TaxID=5786 RepID=F0ZZ40_DICPU|nr:uncharacterized protein DICPUDRAFT_157428 [Dictyostelium purpureum]EGC30798.1 hypothetical protein DICPUDRAFT_157428 [Dictyostelium purpureum]|eukprot:XP_003292688.1 hypothetical protein DICPUDRAFT_157428 [Dictyostelium purpureum]
MMIKFNKSLTLLIILIIGLVCLVSPAFSQQKQAGSTTTTRSAEDTKLLKEFRDLAVKEGGIIQLKTLTQTKKFLQAKNRPYEVLALFTSSNPKYGCAGCLVLNYGASYIQYLESPQFLEKPIFVVILEVDSTLEFFQHVGFNTIPHLVFIPSGSKPIQTKGFTFTKVDQATPAQISNFILSHSKINIEPVRTLYEKYSQQFFGTIIFIASLRFIITAYKKRNNPMFWYFLTILLFSAVIMGIFYDFIHKPALYDYDHRNQKYNYFSRGSRSQTVSEGFIMGVSTLAITLVFIYISDILPNYSRFGTKVKNVLFFLGMGAIISFLYFQSIAFSMKYYRPLFFIPSFEF